MTCSRAAGHWVTSRGRRMTKTEMLRLQGMRTPTGGFEVAVSDTQLGRQIGNAMSCNVLERLFVRLLPAAGLAHAERLTDRWQVAGKAPATPPRQGRRLTRTVSRTPSPLPPQKRARGGVSQAPSPPAKRARS